jgi:hypothetical protein
MYFISNFLLSNLIQYGVSYLGDPFTVRFTIIDFSNFQCYLCARGRVNLAIKAQLRTFSHILYEYFEHDRTSTEVILYALYLYFLDLSFRNTSKAIQPFEEKARKKPCCYMELGTEI